MAAEQGDFAVAVVGESHYQIALRSICGPGEVRHACRALLALEDDNPYDSNAVSVNINGKKVGHLSRDYAVLYRKEWAKSIDLDGTWDALIIGGGDDREFVGVWLDLPDLIEYE